MWDSQPSINELSKDWGAITAATTSSLWPASADYMWPPSAHLLGPSTLDYHLEHTMFPSLNFMLYPRIAPTVEKCCTEYGIPYVKYTSCNEVKQAFYKKLSDLGRL